jgi:hypothetical protein
MFAIKAINFSSSGDSNGFTGAWLDPATSESGDIVAVFCIMGACLVQSLSAYLALR